MEYPWRALLHWAPFRIDALGLVTLLGSDEVNNCIGRLVASRWLEYMPLLGAFVIAGDLIKEKKPSFYLYNTSSGVHTTDLSCWLARWTRLQELGSTRSIVYWEVIEEPRTWWPYHLISGAISTCLIGFLATMSILSKDWYGLANALGMTVSVFVRAYILQANRFAIDATVKRSHRSGSQETGSIRKHTTESKPSKIELKEDISPQSFNGRPSHAKVLLIMSDSKAVTMFIPKRLIAPVFIGNPEPKNDWHWLYCLFRWTLQHIRNCNREADDEFDNDWMYHLLRWVGWLAFAVHIVSLGMAELASQMYTVALLVIPTILTVYRFGCDDSRLYLGWKQRSRKDAKVPYNCWIGSHLKATVFEWPNEMEFELGEDNVWQWKDPKTIKKIHKRSTRRQDLYAWLDLTDEEENSLGKWDLLPHKRQQNDQWASDYNAKMALVVEKSLNLNVIKEEVATIIGDGRKYRTDDLENHAAQNGFKSPLRSCGIRTKDIGLTSDGMVA